MSSSVLLPVTFGVIAFAVSWRVRGRWRRVSFYDETPLGVSNAQYARRQARQRLYARSAWAVVDSLAGAALGWFVAVSLLPR